MNFLQKRMIRRIKCFVGYPLHSAEKLKEENLDQLLTDAETYGLGSVRSQKQFMDFAEIKVNNTNGDLVCTDRLDWCVQGLKE